MYEGKELQKLDNEIGSVAVGALFLIILLAVCVAVPVGKIHSKINALQERVKSLEEQQDTDRKEHARWRDVMRKHIAECRTRWNKGDWKLIPLDEFGKGVE